jgi:hypothetical protein
MTSISRISSNGFATKPRRRDKRNFHDFELDGLSPRAHFGLYRCSFQRSSTVNLRSCHTVFFCESHSISAIDLENIIMPSTPPTPGKSELERVLPHLQKDYQNVNGRPFNHFFCPILFRDEPVDLCMGHIINRDIPRSSRKRVVQRKDVDSFYGKAFESDFVALAQVRDKKIQDVVFDPDLNKKLRPKIFAGNEECDYHSARGHKTPDQTAIVMRYKDGRIWDIVLHKKPPDFVAQAEEKWNVVVEHDCRVPAVVSLIKAAYLTLFRLLGYRYVLSASGYDVGHDILGSFFRRFHDKSAAEARHAAAAYFKPYIHMVRPVAEFSGPPSLGTIEDRHLFACFGTSLCLI